MDQAMKYLQLQAYGEDLKSTTESLRKANEALKVAETKLASAAAAKGNSKEDAEVYEREAKTCEKVQVVRDDMAALHEHIFAMYKKMEEDFSVEYLRENYSYQAAHQQPAAEPKLKKQQSAKLPEGKLKGK